MALPASFLEELRQRTPLASLVGRRVKLAKSGGGSWKGCCPFHNEKSPSFHVYPDHFHCFGCGAHGDAISFVMQSEGADFREAVARLASEAGLAVPEPSPQAAAAEQRRATLYDVMTAANAVFTRRLREPDGAEALAYLRARGLAEETIAKFGLGWAGPGRGALAADLRPHGIETAQLIEAGLMRLNDGRPVDLYFNRITFPIRDRGGRIISFGGRALGDGQPKYVNGPESPLFTKGQCLYGADLARAGVRAGATVLAVEGYMDVIALHQAGFTGAVAPLGTALTEAQLDALWQLSPCPILMFDGDAAGGRAAARAAALAASKLASDRGVSIATVPAGEDPDTLIRAKGPAAMRALIAGARPLSEALYDLLRENAGPSPEQRAAFRARLIAAAATIPDKGLAGEFRSAWLDRFFAERRAKGRPPAVSKPGRPDLADPADAQARALLGAALNHPSLLERMVPHLESLTLPGVHETLRAALIDRDTVTLDAAALRDHLARSGAQAAAAAILHGTALPSFARATAGPEDAMEGFLECAALLMRRSVSDDLARAGAEFSRTGSEQAQARLVALRTAQIRTLAPES